MSRISDTARAVNTGLRTLIAVALTCMVGAAGWFGYTAYTEPGRELHQAQADLKQAQQQLAQRDQRIAALSQDVRQKQLQIAQLETSPKLLKVDHRIAELTVVDPKTDTQTDTLFTTV